MLGWASRLWKANLWFWWYNCFALFVYCVYMFTSTGKRHLGHVWTQLQEKNAFLVPHTSLGSNFTTPIVFKTLIIFNISWSRPLFSACSHTITCFQGSVTVSGGSLIGALWNWGKIFREHARPLGGYCRFFHLLFFLCLIPWALIFT